MPRRPKRQANADQEQESPKPEPSKRGRQNQEPSKRGRPDQEPSKRGRANQEPSKRGRTNQDPSKPEPSKRGRQNQEPSKPEPSKRGRQNQEPSKPEPSKRGRGRPKLVKQETSDSNPADPAPPNPAPIRQESAEPAPTRQESTEPAPTRQESTEPAPTRQESTEPAPTRQESTEPAPTRQESTEPARQETSESETVDQEPETPPPAQKKQTRKKKRTPPSEGIIELSKPKLDLTLTNIRKFEGTAYNSRYFYFFAIYAGDWVLFEFDSLFKMTFTMYDAMELTKHFPFMDFKYAPYSYDLGLVYNEEHIVKIELDHEEKKIKTVGRAFEIPLDPTVGLRFYIHTVLILQNDTVFIYTIRRGNNVSQRLYLQKWEDLDERINMCKIGIRDARASLLYVSGQFVEGKRLCIVQMQDKNRQFGQVTPLSLYWDTDGPVAPEKFEKVECEDGKPFVTILGRNAPPTRKQFTGAWFGHMFNMIFTVPTPAGKRWKTSAFVFDAFLKAWRPMDLPQRLKSSIYPLLSFQNGGNSSHAPMLCFFKKDGGTLPNQMFRMPVRTPEKLKTLAQIETANYGIFNLREQIQVLTLKVRVEQKLAEEHRKKAEEHRKRAAEHTNLFKQIEKRQKRMKKTDIGMSIVPDQLNKFSEFYDM